MIPFDIAPDELKTRMDRGEAFLLLDVREPEELRLAAIEGAVHIPMGDIPTRSVELDDEAHIIVICHHGQRSALVTQFLRQRDFPRVANLAGGIDAWARQVDPAVGRY